MDSVLDIVFWVSVVFGADFLRVTDTVAGASLRVVARATSMPSSAVAA